MCGAQGLSAGVAHQYYIARFRRAPIQDIAGENPGMAGRDPVRALTIDANSNQLPHHSLKAPDSFFS